MEANRFFMIRWYMITGTRPASFAFTCRANSGVAVTGGGRSAEGRSGAGGSEASPFGPPGSAVPEAPGVAGVAGVAEPAGADRRSGAGRTWSTPTAMITTSALATMTI
nr:hypothetical protein GCM10020093_116500 [Planobispora longispora]